MPVRRLRTRTKRLNDQIIEQFREAVRAGYPWEWHRLAPRPRGSVDLLGLVKGHWYGFEEFCKTEETRRFSWEELQGDILKQHVKYRPGTRPAAWWQFQSTEPLRVLRRDAYGQEIHETEREYLTRLNLLTAVEKEIFAKYGNVVLVRVASGDFGKCKDCWRMSEKTALKIDFDLKATVSQHGEFWIPEKLFIGCDHESGPAYSNSGYDGIFEEQ